MSTLVKMLKKCPIPSVLIVSPVRWWRPQISLSRLLWWSSFSRSLFRSFFATSNNAFFCLTWGFLQTGRNDQTFGWPPEHQQGWRWTESTPRGADWFCYSGRSLLLSLWMGWSFVQDLMPGIEIILGQKGHFWLQSHFSSLDEKFVLESWVLSHKYFHAGSSCLFLQDKTTQATWLESTKLYYSRNTTTPSTNRASRENRGRLK